MQDSDAGPKLMDDDGKFHAQDESIDLSGTPAEAWAALALFWALGLTVLYQFITRYALNDSAAWTEEIARYLLIGVVFVGASIGVAKNNHVQVDFLFHYLPRKVARVLSTAVDLMRIGFLASAVVLTAKMMQKMDSYQMTVVDLPMNIVYGVCLLGFCGMLFRSMQVAWIHHRRGYSVLERPETTMKDR